MKFSWGRLAAVVAAIWLWMALIQPPYPPNPNLDPSWEGALGFAHLHGWQFGKDIIFTAGAWTWATCIFVPRGTLGAKVLWEIAGKFLLAAGLVALSARIRGLTRWIFLIAVAFGFPDTSLVLYVALAVLVWLLPEETPSRWRFAAILSLSFIAHLRFNYCLLVSAGIATTCFADVLRGHWRRAALEAGGFAAAFLLLWVAAGQNLMNLPAYLRSSSEISRGYVAAMGFDETRPIFLLGVGVCLLNLLFLAQLWLTFPDRVLGRSSALFLAFFFFLIWKHGFVRADSHVDILFTLSFLSALALPALFPLKLGRWFNLNAGLCAAGAWLANPGLVVTNAHRAVGLKALAGEAGRLFDFKTVSADYEREARELANDDPLPAVRRIVGQATIDSFNFQQGELFVNGLNYRPRPVLQSYSAYTPALMTADLRFFQSSRAPDFIFFRYQSIDGRYPTEEDALALAEIPRRYSVAYNSGDAILLRRRAGLSLLADLHRQPAASFYAGFGRDLTLPSDRTHALWLQADLPLTFLGKLRAALYKPPLLGLVITDETGWRRRYRIVPSIAKEGFLIQPFIDSAADYASLVYGTGRKWVQSLRLEAPPGEEKYWGRCFLHLSRIPELPIAARSRTEEYVDYRAVNLTPVAVVSAVAANPDFDHGRGIAFVHAPGRMDFDLPPNIHRLSGSFGLRDGSYTGAGRTEGADFAVDAIIAGKVTRIWHRFLDPLSVASDRGRQSFSVEIPSGVSQVRLLTLPRRSGYSNWDWTYWSELEFR